MGETRARRRASATAGASAQSGRLVHAEDFAIGPDVAATLAAPAVARRRELPSPPCSVSRGRRDACSTPCATSIGEAGGASAWTVGGSGKLLARLIADDGYELRKRLVPLIELLNGQAGLPKVWSL